MNKTIKTISIFFLPLLAVLNLSGCIEDSDSNEASKDVIRSYKLTGELSRSEIDGLAAQAGLTQLAGSAKCDVNIYEITFNTLGVNGEAAVETGALFLPSGSECEQSIPLLVNGHGTRTYSEYSNVEISNSLVDIAIYAAQGYGVVSPNYLGLGGSDYGFHPYLHANTQAYSMVNSILAAQHLATKLETDLSGKVMIKGYSQGGHTTMAAQKLIEDQFNTQIDLVASSPMAGPYTLEDTLLNGVNAEISNIASGVLLAYIIQSYQQAYGDIYTDIDSVFLPAYTDVVKTSFPGGRTVFELILGQIFPPNPEQYLQMDYLTDFLQNSDNALRQAINKNEVLNDFIPKTPTLLCGSSLDGTVPFNNTTQAAADFTQKGIEVTVLDVASYVVVEDGEEPGLTHHLKGNPICNAFVRDQFFAKFL